MFETLNVDNIKKLAATVAQVSGPLVVVHGAGSFGHFQAKEYAVSEGLLHDSSKRGFALTRRSVTKLSGIIVEALLEVGVAAVAVSPFPWWTTSGGALKEEDLSHVTALLKEILSKGFVPVLHGDCVLDDDRGGTILSGDTIMSELASTLTPSLVVFVTCVDGVYTQPPAVDGATLIPHISVNGQTQPEFGADVLSHDVTGGIIKKVETAATIARRGTPVIVCGVDGAFECLTATNPTVPHTLISC